MKGKSSYYWPLLILGFIFIGIVTFCFLHYYEGLCVSQIMKDKSPAGEVARKNLWTALLYIPGSLLITAAIFYWAARQFGWGSGSMSGSANLQTELDECRKQYNDLLVQSSGGKIDHEFNAKHDRPEGLGMAASAGAGAAAATGLSSDDDWEERVKQRKENLKSKADFEGENTANIAEGLKDESQNISSGAEEPSETKTSDSNMAGSMEEEAKADQGNEIDSKKDAAQTAMAAGAAGASASNEDTSSAANFDDSKAKGVFGKKIKVDDLKLVEGIGPKIESILNKYNVNTWKDLANESPEKISEYLLTEGGASYKIHDPSTWPKQALLAAEGKFEELKKLQDNLKGGREVS